MEILQDEFWDELRGDSPFPQTAMMRLMCAVPSVGVEVERLQILEGGGRSTEIDL